MKLITPTIRLGDTGAQVANLQDALLALLSRSIIKSLATANRPTDDELKKLAEDLKQERAQSLFGKATFQLIIYFQVQQSLGDNLQGVVEDKTAAKLNDRLKSIGALVDATSLVVRGTVKAADGQPISGASIKAFEMTRTRTMPSSAILVRGGELIRSIISVSGTRRPPVAGPSDNLPDRFAIELAFILMRLTSIRFLKQ